MYLSRLTGYLNLALEQSEEFRDGQLQAKYGDCFIRGNNGACVFDTADGMLTLVLCCSSIRSVVTFHFMLNGSSLCRGASQKVKPRRMSLPAFRFSFFGGEALRLWLVLEREETCGSLFVRIRLHVARGSVCLSACRRLFVHLASTSDHDEIDLRTT